MLETFTFKRSLQVPFERVYAAFASSPPPTTSIMEVFVGKRSREYSYSSADDVRVRYKGGVYLSRYPWGTAVIVNGFVTDGATTTSGGVAGRMLGWRHRLLIRAWLTRLIRDLDTPDRQVAS